MKKNINPNDFALCYKYFSSFTEITDEEESTKNMKDSFPVFLGTSRPIYFIYFIKKENVDNEDCISYEIKGFPYDILHEKPDNYQSRSSNNENKKENIQFLTKLIQSLNLDYLEKMLSRYYVEDYSKFCVYISLENYKNLPLHQFFFPPQLYQHLRFFKFEKKYVERVVVLYYEHMLDEITNSFHNKYLEKNIFKEYIKLLYQIISQFEFEENLIYENCNILDRMYKDLTAKTDILSDYLKEVLTSLTDELIKKEVLSTCKHCNSFFKSKKTKRYCSLTFEGRNCGKKSRNKRYFKKNIKKLRPQSKKNMQELREARKEWIRKGKGKEWIYKNSPN